MEGARRTASSPSPTIHSGSYAQSLHTHSCSLLASTCHDVQARLHSPVQPVHGVICAA